MQQAQTLYEKLWSSHVVREEADGTALIYIDRHLVHEVKLRTGAIQRTSASTR